MAMKIRLLTAALLASLSMGVMAQDPSIHDVYQAADRGQVTQAQQLMAQVLKDHPGSAKAHYVEAELLARQRQFDQAKAELAQAEKLQPGLTFAKPAAVSELKAKLAQPVQSNWSGAPAYGQAPAQQVPWGMIIGALALVALGYAWFRSRQQQAVVYGGGQPMMAGPNGGYGPYGGSGSYGSAMPYPGSPMPGTGSGLGSQLLGGLATGAAVGAGMIAGESLMHRMLGDDANRDLSRAQNIDAPRFNDNPPDASYDMGGQDFGLQDTGSWDDGGGGGGGSDDWN